MKNEWWFQSETTKRKIIISIYINSDKFNEVVNKWIKIIKYIQRFGVAWSLTGFLASLIAIKFK